MVDDWTAAVMSSKGQKAGLWLWYARHRDRRAHASISLGRLSARAVPRALVAAIAARKDTKPAPAAALLSTWGDACDYWSGEQGAREKRGRIEGNTRRGYRDAARRVKRLVGRLPIQARIQHVVDAYSERSKHAQTTQRQDVSAIGAIYGWLCDLGLCQLARWERPRWRTPKPVYRDRVPTPAEVAAVLACWPSDSWWYGAVLLLAATGLRREELGAVQPGDLELWAEDDAGYVRVGLHAGARKTGARELPITGQALVWAREHLRHPDRVWPVARVSFGSEIRKHIEAGCKAAQVEPFTPKGLRAMVSTQAQERGVSGLAYEAMLGHSERTGRRDYAEHRREMMRQAAQDAGLGIFPGALLKLDGGKD